VGSAPDLQSVYAFVEKQGTFKNKVFEVTLYIKNFVFESAKGNEKMLLMCLIKKSKHKKIC
jgi:hypothetical protein